MAYHGETMSAMVTPEQLAMANAKHQKHVQSKNKRQELEGEWEDIGINEDSVKVSLAEHKLPASIYSAGIITLFGFYGGKEPFSNCNMRTVCHDCLLSWPAFGLVIINYFLQGGMTMFIATAVNKMKQCEEEDKRDERLLWLGITVFVFSMSTEITETLDMFKWIWYLNVGANHSENEEDDMEMEDMGMPLIVVGDGTQEGAGIHGTSHRWNRVFWKKHDRKYDRLTGVYSVDPDEAQLFGFVGYFKIVCSISAFIIPKLVIAIALLIIGTKFLMRSATSTDIILNAVALQFIVQIDEALYQAFTAEQKKKYIENLPPVRQPPTCLATFCTSHCPWCMPYDTGDKEPPREEDDKKVACDSWMNWVIIPWVNIILAALFSVFFYWFFHCKGTMDLNPGVSKGDLKPVATGQGNLTFDAGAFK